MQKIKVTVLAIIAIVLGGCGSSAVDSTDTTTTINHAPVTSNDRITLTNDASSYIFPLQNDSDSDGDTLSIKTMSGPTYGSARIISDRIYYTPKEDFVGTDLIRYQATDGQTLSRQATITITLTSPQSDSGDSSDTSDTTDDEDTTTAPVGVADFVYIDQNQEATIDVLSNDISSGELSIKETTNPSHGSIEIENDTIIYSPQTDYYGEDGFTYIPYDGINEGEATAVKITMQTTNQAPKGVEDSLTITQGESDVAIDVLANDTDADGDRLYVDKVSQPQHGTTYIEDDKVIYSPTKTYYGEDSFTYTPYDGSAYGTAVEVSIEIVESSATQESNHAPVAANDTVTIALNSPATLLEVLENDIDVDGDTISIASLTQPPYGRVSIVEGGVEYTPKSGFSGKESFKYVPTDGQSNGAEATVTIYVTDENIAPVGVDDEVELFANTSAYIDLLENDIDQNGDTLSFTLLSWPTHGTLQTSQEQLIYTPQTDYVGTDSFTYEPSDGESEGNATTVTLFIRSKDALSISGTVTYDRVPTTRTGLDYANITAKASRGVVVRLYDEYSRLVEESLTDDTGKYRFDNLEQNQSYKVRVYAYLKNDQWSVKVVDNTDDQAQYVMEGELTVLSSQTTVRNFNADSGWNTTSKSYSGERVAAPFAILDNVYSALLEVQEAQEGFLLPSLLINWSPNNRAINGDKTIGYISTSHYDSSDEQLWILGYANEDTDEYDKSVIIHEFGHYLKAKLARQDTIGGNHNISSKLDLRLAYEEGWCNAFSGMILNNPIYIDTTGSKQSYSSVFDMETSSYTQKGWYSEASIHRIFYDLFDGANESHDTIALGFAPIFKVVSSVETQYPALLSIFTFVYGLKNENPSKVDAIDRLVANENIDSVEDYYGANQSNDGGDSDALPIYRSIEVDETKQFCTKNTFGTTNRLLNHILIKINIPSSDDYDINLQQVSLSGEALDANPDFKVYSTSPYVKLVGWGLSSVQGYESNEADLNRGLHIIDLYDTSGGELSCFELLVEESGWWIF